MAKVEESKPLHQICAKQENSKCTRSVTTLNQTSDSLFIECITQEVDQINQVYCKQVYSFKLETGALVNSFTHILPTWVY